MSEIRQKDKAEIEDTTVYKVQYQTPRKLYYRMNTSSSDYFSPDFVSKIVTNHRISVSEICINSLVLQILKENLRPSARILHVGCKTGYLVACFLRLIRTDGDDGDKTSVVGLTKEASLIQEIKHNLYTDDPTFLRSGSVIIMEGEYNQGCPQHAPFDAIFVSAAPSRRPNALISQLAPGGRMLLCTMPLSSEPYLLQFDKNKNGTVDSKRLMTLTHLSESHLHTLRTQLNNYFD